MIGISGYANTPFSGFVYGGYTAASSAAASSDAGKAEVIKNPGESTKVSPGRRSSPAECQTCKERKYQDGSDENVSFKSAQRSRAGACYKCIFQSCPGRRQVINASVAIHTAICPECGRTYVSGGTTTTMIKYNNEKNPYTQNKKANDAMGLRGQSLDLAI